MSQIKNRIKDLSNKLMFDLNDVELEKIVNEYQSIINSIEKIKSVKIDNVPPTNFIEKIRLDNTLNDDNYVEYDPTLIFANCKHFVNGMVVIKDEKK